jgi:hypothetical protein
MKSYFSYFGDSVALEAVLFFLLALPFELLKFKCELSNKVKFTSMLSFGLDSFFNRMAC